MILPPVNDRLLHDLFEGVSIYFIILTWRTMLNRVSYKNKTYIIKHGMVNADITPFLTIKYI